MKLRVGIIGVGNHWEKRYRPALRTLADRFEVRGVCSQVAALGQQVARDFNALTFDGYRSLCSRSDIDAVLLLASEWYGPLPILAACDYGKAVYCATTLELDPARAQAIRRRVEEAGIAFMAEFPRRQTPATLRLKELIATSLGAPKMLFCHARREMNSAPRGYGVECPVDVQDMMELADWCSYVVGSDPKSVFSVRHRVAPDQDADDYQMLNLEFSDSPDQGTGPLAQISCSRYLARDWHEAVAFRPPAELQVCCERGVAFVDLPNSLVWFDEAGRHRESLDMDRPVGEQLLTQFHRSVTSLVRKTSDLRDAYRALQIVRGAQQSCREGRRVTLSVNGENG